VRVPAVLHAVAAGNFIAKRRLPCVGPMNLARRRTKLLSALREPSERVLEKGVFEVRHL
jgi:hypothetical protein